MRLVGWEWRIENEELKMNKKKRIFLFKIPRPNFEFSILNSQLFNNRRRCQPIDQVLFSIAHH